MTGPGHAAWLPDPEGRYEYRWWDGQNWTDQVSQQGQVGTVPMSGGAPPQPQHSAPPVAAGDGFAGITGDLVDGRFSEKESAAVANQNRKMLRVRLGEPFMARQGAMVAY